MRKKENQEKKTFDSLRVLPLVHTYTASATAPVYRNLRLFPTTRNIGNAGAQRASTRMHGRRHTQAIQMFLLFASLFFSFLPCIGLPLSRLSLTTLFSTYSMEEIVNSLTA